MSQVVFEVTDESADPNASGQAATFTVGVVTEGPPGDPGDPGEQGDPGDSAYAVALANGFVGTVEEWLDSLIGVDGDDGESAYEVAVEAGFSGTVDQWLASLVGPQGPPGEDGTGGTGTVATVEGVSPDEDGNIDLGLGTAATSDTGDFDPAGAASSAQTAAEGYTDSAITSEVSRADAAYATAAQGATADTAVQPEDLSTVATTGAYADLTGKPTIPSTASDVGAVPTTRTVNGHALSADVTVTAADVSAPPTTRTVSAGTGLTGGGDLSANRTLAADFGTAAGKVTQGNDSRLSDARTPTAHASSHAAAGSDPVTLAESQVTNLTTDLAAKLAKASNLSDLASASTARTNLGLGTAATVDTGTASGNVPLLSAGGRLPVARLASGTADGTKFIADDGTLKTPSGGGGSNKDARWNVLSGQTSIDEFNDSILDAAWARVDGTGAASGNLTWTEDADVLSAYNHGGDTTDKFHALLRPLSGAGGSMAAGDGFVTCLRLWAPTLTNFSIVGLALADGTAFGSGNQVWAEVGITSTAISLQVFSWTNFGTAGTSAGTLSTSLPVTVPIYIRLVMTAANTWRADFSVDGASWIKGKATVSKTMTPTQIGFFSSSYGSATEHIASWEFLRRVAGVS